MVAPSSVFPTLHSCLRVPWDDTIPDDEEDAMKPKGKRKKQLKYPQLFDVKFFPYGNENDRPIYAAVGSRNLLLFEPLVDKEGPCALLHWWQHDNPEASFNSLAWSVDTDSGNPLLCIAGSVPMQILIFDLGTRSVVRSLAGHGQAVNDLAISPIATNLLLSASQDCTLRLWNLDSAHRDQPCVAIFAGEGHRAGLLCAQFHSNGRWIISGGFDTAICLWLVPSEEELNRSDGPITVHYPMFKSNEVHHNYVDAVNFFGDLILSRAALDGQSDQSNELLLWSIRGFDSDAMPPAEPPIPEPGIDTRSAFQPGDRHGFERHLTLAVARTNRYYHRFGLFHAMSKRPILCISNEKSKFLFWDLQELEECSFHNENSKAKPRSKKAIAINYRDERPHSAVPVGNFTAHASIERKSVRDDPFEPIAPHHIIDIPLELTTVDTRWEHSDARALAWSPDGTWLVGVGDYGMMYIFHRDKSSVI